MLSARTVTGCIAGVACQRKVSSVLSSPSLPLPSSSLPALFELHGNSNVEKCIKCGHEYLRDFRVVTGLFHYTGPYIAPPLDVVGAVYGEMFFVFTGRHCDDKNCQGRLIDTIINFGESLPQGNGTPISSSVNEQDLPPSFQTHWRLVLSMLIRLICV